ncbi:MAG: hypothetical protein AAB432_01600 [Patescibacteria group bacterium]
MAAGNEERTQIDKQEIESVTVGSLIDKGGEPLYSWFKVYMESVIKRIDIVTKQQGLPIGRKLFSEAGKLLKEMMNRLNHVDRDPMLNIYIEKMRSVNLKLDMKMAIQIPTRSAESKSLYLDHQPPPFEDRYLALKIGGGKIANRYPRD